MTPPFKMKGYTYPGKSPIKQDPKDEIKLDKKTPSYDYKFSDASTPTAPKSPKYVKPKSTVKVRDYEKEKTDRKAARKKERGEFWKGLAGEAGKAIAIAGIQAGVAALTRPKDRPSRKGPDISGFSGIQFGRK